MKKIYKVAVNPDLNVRGFADQYYYCDTSQEALELFKKSFEITEIEDNSVFVIEMNLEPTLNMINWYSLHYTYLKNEMNKINKMDIGKNIIG